MGFSAHFEMSEAVEKWRISGLWLRKYGNQMEGGSLFLFGRGHPESTLGASCHQEMKASSMVAYQVSKAIHAHVRIPA